MNLNSLTLNSRKVTFTSTQTLSSLPYNKELKEINAYALESAFDTLINNIRLLQGWPENWDSFGSAKPRQASISNAEKWLEELFKVAHDYSLEWIQPVISGDENGNVVLEWWNNNKKLTLDIEPLMAEYTEISDLYGEPKLTNGTLGGIGERNKTSKSLPLLRWIFS